LSLPLVVFYEIAILVGRLQNRRKRRAAAAEG
jgi:Sec-independent protein secretion pathway component TatC